MNGSTLHKTAADCAEGLPGARLEHPFGPDWEVYKVRGKVFMLMTEVPGRPVVILKADPDDAHALREQYSHITPGYHMNKKHWITLESGEGVNKELIRELVTDSYRLVVAHLPRAEQPVDPRALEQRAPERACPAHHQTERPDRSPRPADALGRVLGQGRQEHARDAVRVADHRRDRPHPSDPKQGSGLRERLGNRMRGTA